MLVSTYDTFMLSSSTILSAHRPTDGGEEDHYINISST